MPELTEVQDGARLCIRLGIIPNKLDLHTETTNPIDVHKCLAKPWRLPMKGGKTKANAAKKRQVQHELGLLTLVNQSLSP